MTSDHDTLYFIDTGIKGKRMALFDFAIWKNGLAFKEIDFSETGKPVIKIAELNNGITASTAYTDKDYSPDVHLTKGDMVFSWSGNPQTSIDTYWYDLPDGWLNQHIFKVTPDKSVVDKFFFFYVMKYLKPTFTAIAANKQTTGLGHVTIADLKRLSVVVPEKRTQVKIAVVLSAIDDKIKINNEINKNLAEQSQLLFSEWQAQVSNKTHSATLDDVCIRITDGSHFSPHDDSKSSIPMLSVKDMQEYDFDFSACKHISQSDFSKMITNDCVPQLNDILVAKDGSYLKEIFICNENRDVAVLSSIAIFRPNTSLIYPEILLAFLKSPSVLRTARDNYVSGSALPRIVLKDFKKLQLSLPDKDNQKQIAEVLITFRNEIANNISENEKLAKLRDSLLPKLMSGELDVSQC